MATLTVRKLDDTVYHALGVRARRNKRSLEAEVRQILAEQVNQPVTVDNIDQFLAELAEFRHKNKDLNWPEEDSVALIRAIRDEE